MANIPSIKIGGTTYNVKDAAARRDIELDHERLVFSLKFENGETTLPLIASLSTAGLIIPRRMSTDFLIIPGDFEVYCDVDNSTVSFNVQIYNSSFVDLGDVSSTKTRIKKIYFNAADYPNAKYMKVYICNWSDPDVDLTEAQNEFARKHIILRTGIKVKSFKEFSPDDFQQGRCEENPHVLLVDNFTRATSNVFYKNTDDAYPIVNSRFDQGRFYLKYYDSSFRHVDADSSWCANYMETKEESYPYFKMVLSKDADHASQDLSTADAQTIASHIRPGCKIMHAYTIRQDGTFMNVGKIRCCEVVRTYVKDGYVKCLDPNYSYDIVEFEGTTGEVSAETGWMSYADNYGLTDKAIQVRDRYVSIIFAKIDRTSEFTAAEIEELNAKYSNGQLYEIIESISPTALGDEIKNGYPLYYDSEVKNTVDTACTKTGVDSVRFAMITDLHDNDHFHLSETVKKQVMALKDLNKKNGLDFVICGGDLTDGSYSAKADLLDKMSDMTRLFKEIGVPVMFVRGNHDDNSYAGVTPSLVVKREEFFARCIAPFRGKEISSGKTYYYQDFDDINVRVICLDFIDYPWEIEDSVVVYHAVGGDGVWRGYSDDQITWLLSDALNCNKRIIVTGHYSTHPNLMTSWEKSIEHNYTLVNQALQAYNSRGSVTFGGQTYSFSGKTGKVLIEVSGHSHSFGAFKDNGIVWSSTGSPSPEVTERTFDDTDYETMGSRTYGDITEAHFNMFVCDNNNVHIISFGQMGDLDFEI